MPNNQPRRIPKYRHYKPKDLGVVRINGIDEYLGKYDSRKAGAIPPAHRGMAQQRPRQSRAGSDPRARRRPSYHRRVNTAILAVREELYYSKEGNHQGIDLHAGGDQAAPRNSTAIPAPASSAPGHLSG